VKCVVSVVVDVICVLVWRVYVVEGQASPAAKVFQVLAIAGPAGAAFSWRSSGGAGPSKLLPAALPSVLFGPIDGSK